jgi:hypothetical protein
MPVGLATSLIVLEFWVGGAFHEKGFRFNVCAESEGA